MTKSVMALLLGKALEEKKIQSLEDYITKYIPEYQNDSLATKVRILDLVGMSSGLDWIEKYYSVFGIINKAYFGYNIDNLTLSLKFVDTAGVKYRYLSGNTQILGYILRKQTGMSLSEYLSQSLWQPLGMTSDAYWSLDHSDGVEIAFCCLNTSAYNFAKIGQLILQKGQWQGQSLIDSNYIKKMTSPYLDPENGLSINLSKDPNLFFYYMEGFLGQYTIVVPQENMVIVRLGKQKIKNTEDPKAMTLEAFTQYVIKAINNK